MSKIFKIAILNVKTILGHHCTDLIETICDENKALSKSDIELTPVVLRQQVGAKMTFNNKEYSCIALEGFLAECAEQNHHFDVIISLLSDPMAVKWSDTLLKHTDRLIDASLHGLKQADAVYKIKDLKAASGHITMPMGQSLAVAALLDNLNDMCAVNAVNGTALYPMAHYGKPAMDELFEQSKLSYIHQDVQPKFFKKKIAFNVLPYHEDIMSDGTSIQEWQLKAEIARLTKDNKIKTTNNISVMTIPTFNGLMLDLKLTFADEVGADQIRDSLKQDEDNFLVIDDRRFETMPAGLEVANSRQAIVTRVREDFTSDTGANLIVMLDPVAYRGAWFERLMKTILL